MNSRPKPNLFIVGAPKCGTTAWVEYLGAHNDVFFAEPKEPHFFNTDMPDFRWFKSEEDYLELFEYVGDAKVCGEASIMYLYSHDAARNIHAYNPDAKVLIFVRSHGSFIASYHQQLLYNRDENDRDLASAWDKSGRRDKTNLPPHCREPRFVDYKSVGNFADQIQRYLNFFPAENVMLVEFESWTADARATYLEILSFLDLADDGKNDFPRVNSAHRHKSNALANLTQRPPTIVHNALTLLRKFPGLQDFRPSRWLRKMNRAEGYSTRPDEQLLKEIDAFYEGDKLKVEKLLQLQGKKLR